MPLTAPSFESCCVAFLGVRRVASGNLREMVPAVLEALAADPHAPLAVFDDASGETVELDWRGSAGDVLARLDAAAAAARTAAAAGDAGDAGGAGGAGGAGDAGDAGGGAASVGAVGQAASGPVIEARGRGRPRLGVVAREVTLLPRHWAWLGSQPGGASVALRKLVDEARRTHEGRDRVRAAQQACYRFMAAIAGNAPRFEDAARALFAGHAAAFADATAGWPADVRAHALALGERAWGAASTAGPAGR